MLPSLPNLPLQAPSAQLDFLAPRVMLGSQIRPGGSVGSAGDAAQGQVAGPAAARGMHSSARKQTGKHSRFRKLTILG